MSVLDRAALDDSPLADLHAIASELSIDGYRRLRRADLIDSIVAHQGGGEVVTSADADLEVPTESAPADSTESASTEEQAPPRRRRGRRGGRGRSESRDETETETDADASDGGEAPASGEKVKAEKAPAPTSAGRMKAEKAPVEKPAAEKTAAEKPAAEKGAVEKGAVEKGAVGKTGAEKTPAAKGPAEEEPEGAATAVEGVVELLPNGSGFLRVSPPDPSDDDVYISAAQVKRCELLSGDRISGPPRAPRRSERFPSLVRVDTINGRPASEVAEGSRFDDLPAAFPEERIRLGSEDPTVMAIEWLTPIGKGSRVTIVGATRAGKSEALRRLASSLAEHSELQLSVVLAGVRPEEIADWQAPLEPAAAVSFAVSPDVQAHVIEPVVDTARRLAGRGGDVVLLIDTLDGLPPLAARKVLAAARNIVGGGSLTVIATATVPIGGETTVIALDAALVGMGRFPAIDLLSSGTIRPERLVGEAAAEAIARARSEAAEQD